MPEEKRNFKNVLPRGHLRTRQPVNNYDSHVCPSREESRSHCKDPALEKRGAEPLPRGCPQTSRKPGVKQRGVIGDSSRRGTTEHQGDERSWRLASSGGGREASLEQILWKLPREGRYLDTRVVSFNPVSTGASQGSRQGHRSTEGQTGPRHLNDDNIRVLETGGLRKSPHF